MTQPLIEVSLDEFVPLAWSLLQRAPKEGGPLKTPVLATVGPDGLPQARVIVLRAADPQARALEFYTDARSPKAAALEALPQAALCFYDPASQLQLRVSGRVDLHRDADERARLAWNTTGTYGRRSYLTAAAPGSPLEAAGDGLPSDCDPLAASGKHLLVVRLEVEHLDWLVLDNGGHRRAEARANEDGSWATRWLVP